MALARPVILYACVHNSGRSVAAQALTRHHARDQVEVRSAGSEPADQLNPTVAAALAERGVTAYDHVPTLLTPDAVEASDVVVTMGCGETCPVLPGKRYLDWEVRDPKDQDMETVREIVAEIDRKVQVLLAELLSPTSHMQ